MQHFLFTHLLSHDRSNHGCLDLTPAMRAIQNGDASTTGRFRNHCRPRAQFCPPLVSHMVSTVRSVISNSVDLGCVVSGFAKNGVALRLIPPPRRNAGLNMHSAHPSGGWAK